MLRGRESEGWKTEESQRQGVGYLVQEAAAVAAGGEALGASRDSDARSMPERAGTPCAGYKTPKPAYIAFQPVV